MTRWERFFRWMGGAGPGDPEGPLTPGPVHFPSLVARGLIELGFLKRDPDLPWHEAIYFVNYRWQWRFWRGPYKDCLEKMYAEGKLKRPPFPDGDVI